MYAGTFNGQSSHNDVAKPDPLHWKEYFKTIKDLPKNMLSQPSEAKNLPVGLDAKDNLWFKSAQKNVQADGIPTVYLSPFNGKSFRVLPNGQDHNEKVTNTSLAGPQVKLNSKAVSVPVIKGYTQRHKGIM